MNIDFNRNEDVLKPPTKKQVLDNLSASVRFVRKYRQGKTRVKSIDQLLNEL
jgi:hypothetical protein